MNHPTTPPLRSEFADDPDMAEIIAEFVSELPDRARAIESSFREGENETLKRLAHQLAGASAGYGFPDLGRKARELEHAILNLAAQAHAEQTERVRSLVDSLTAMCRNGAGQ